MNRLSMAKRVRKPIPNQIRRYRRKQNLRLCDIAVRAGLGSVSHVSHWEKGRKVPSLENALKLSAIIQCPVEVLFYDLFDSLRQDIKKREEQLAINA